MLNRIDDLELAGALARLAVSPEAPRLLQHLRDSLAILDVRGRSLDGVALSRNQGGALTLAALISQIETAPENLRKLRS